ncbi:BamA/TamA family outer membrane protein [Photobacterium alginatilyticum]|uniref:BamA/TamA family outer membrane protein n=1 Tax=Photobacterium alginatilyticum TaxID=1775171 RepID=UPI004068E45E
MKSYCFKAAAIAAALSYSFVTHADGWPSWEPETAAVPFVFTSDSMGLAVGMAGVLKGAGQPQAALLGAGLVTDKETWLAYLGASNYIIDIDSRWLFGAELYSAEFKQFDYYLGEATRNDSVADDATIADAAESQYRISARYILPLGAAETQGIKAALRPERPLSGHTPWTSGVTSLEFRPFYQSREFFDLATDDPAFSEAESVWGLETRLDWDNRNNSRNPTTGSRSQFGVTYDPGSSDHASWWKWELSQSWFWDIGALGEVFDQQVMALNVYTGDTPSWNSTESVNGVDTLRRPPAYAGTRLGGLYRLRSFQSGRFVDRAALSYSMEYRVLPDWQPLSDWPVFNWYDVPWWQWVAFVDFGRVAGEYDLKTLHQDMKWSAGGAIRFQVEGIVVRTEMAWGSEDSLFRVMINQPF